MSEYPTSVLEQIIGETDKLISTGLEHHVPRVRGIDVAHHDTHVSINQEGVDECILCWAFPLHCHPDMLCSKRESAALSIDAAPMLYCTRVQVHVLADLLQQRRGAD